MKLKFTLHGFHSDYPYFKEENFIYPWKLVGGKGLSKYFKTEELIFEPKRVGTVFVSYEKTSNWYDYKLKKL